MVPPFLGFHTAQLLVRLGAHVAFVSSTGMSALHMAVTHSTPTVAAMLLKEYGVSTCMRDNKGWTALDMAASKGRADMIQILLEGESSITRTKYMLNVKVPGGVGGESRPQPGDKRVRSRETFGLRGSISGRAG